MIVSRFFIFSFYLDVNLNIYYCQNLNKIISKVNDLILNLKSNFLKHFL